MLFGSKSSGGAPSAPSSTATQKTDTGETDAEKSRKALLAVNAGGGENTATLGVTSPATVTRRYLLGL